MCLLMWSPLTAQRGSTRYKLACMSAGACGALQLKMQQRSRQALKAHVPAGMCHCGPPESLFPIPLVESCKKGLRLYYGKTFHDDSGS